MDHDPLARPNYLHCFPLHATMSVRQCLINQGRGKVYPESLYYHCRTCKSGKNVAKHFKGQKATVWEIKNQYGKTGQMPDSMIAAKLAGTEKMKSKVFMIREVYEKLTKTGKKKREIEKVLAVMRSATTAVARSFWQEVVRP